MNSAKTQDAPKSRTCDTHWRIEPMVLLAIAGLLIGLASGYWGRETLNRSQQAEAFAVLRDKISETNTALASVEARILEMRLMMNKDIDARIVSSTQQYRSDLLRMEQKIDAIDEQIVELKLDIKGMNGSKTPP